MTNEMRKKIFVVIGVLLLAGICQGVVIRSENLLPGETILSVSTYQTTGADMVGMAVTVFFSSAPSETVLWTMIGVDAGAATGTDGDWSLSESGDTFSNPWTLFYQGGKGLLTGFRLDGFSVGPGEVGVMFDRTFNGMFGTDGSFLGRDFEYPGGSEPPFDTFVTYESAIALGAAPPVGDEFRYLNVKFLNLPGYVDEFTSVPPQVSGLDGNNLRSLSFYQDTNNPIVPEPATIAFLTCGTLLILRRRKETI